MFRELKNCISDIKVISYSVIYKPVNYFLVVISLSPHN